MARLTRFVIASLLLALAAPAAAQESELPFWASIRAKKINMRVGPGQAYRINWVYHRVHLPMKVLRVMEGWWLVQDPDGARGWVLASLMTRKRGAIVTGHGLAELHESADQSSRLLWRLERGVTGKLGDCEAGWCEFDLGEGREGWVRRERLWGAQNL